MKFCLVFSGAFAGFAVIWCLVYFVLKGKHGEVLGFLFGIAMMCLILRGALPAEKGKSFLAAVSVAFTLHIAGYLIGDYLFYGVLLPRGFIAAGKLAWGFCHGFGFGAGLGWVLQVDGSQR